MKRAMGSLWKHETENSLPVPVRCSPAKGKKCPGTVLVLILAILCYGGCLERCGSIQRNSSVCIVLADHSPDRAEVSEILRDQKENGKTEEICFYREAGLVTAKEPSFGRQAKALLADVQGNAAAFDWCIRGFSEDDREGCIIDKKTAEDLFGSIQAEGRELQVHEKRYQVRSVVSWKQPLILIRSEDREAVYGRIYFDCEEGNRTDRANQFLMRYGLSGIQADGSIFAAAAGVSVLLLPMAIFLRLFAFAEEQRRGAESKKEGWIWTAGASLMLAVLVCVGWKYFAIPSDWLPGKWSDFSFWSRRIAEEKEKNMYFLMLSRTAGETEMLYYAVSAAFRGVLSVVFYLWWIILRKK
ncbi:MAG: ABC transporter permease [Eubacteriales bacterium]|nr:ABC transporter permease [Eubacteriales bacterium]